MANVKFKKTTSTNLDSVPISDGQIVAVTDTGELLIDFDGARTKYGGGSDADLSEYLTEDDLRGTGEYSASLCTDGAVVSGEAAIAIGHAASATKFRAIQIGSGQNNSANTFQVFNATLLDADGKIPDERLSDNVALISDIPKDYLTEDNLENYVELDSDGKIPVNCIPDGVGGSSWKWKELEDTALVALVLDNVITVFTNDLVSADFSSISLVGENLYSSQSIVRFHSGATPTVVTCGSVKFIGLHCYAGVFTPQKNTYYTITAQYLYPHYVASVGGYAG